MKEKSKNLIMLKDLVNEQFLLEQVSSLYNCPPGYGHNPFTGTCYPIPNKVDAISGLEGPKVVKSQGDTKTTDEPGPDPTNKDEIKALVVKMRPFWDNPVEGTAECFKNYPISSFVGAILGASSAQQGFIRTGLKVAAKAVVPVKFTLKAGGTLGLLGLLAVISGVGVKTLEDNFDATETVDFLSSAIKKGKAFLNSEWTDWTYAGAACAANLLAATYFLAKGGKIIGKGVLKDLVQKKDFLDETSKLLGRSTVKVLGEKPTHATLWVALKQRNLLPKDKEIIELSKDGILMIPKGQIVTVPTNRLSKRNLNLFKDFIKGDEVVLDLNNAAAEFQKASSEIIHVTAGIYHKQAKNVVKNSRMIEDFQKLVGIIGKGGQVSRKKLINQYLKETANVLEEFAETSRPQIKKLYEDGLKLKGKEPTFIKQGELKKAREFVARGDNPSSVVAKQKISPKNKKALEEYLTLYQSFSKSEQELASKFASIKSFMEQEANFSKLYGKNIDLRAALTSKADIIQQKRITTAIGQLKQFSKQMREAVVGTNIRSSLTNSIDELTFFTLASGAAYTGAVLVPRWRNELSLPYIYEAAESFFAQKGDEYLKSLQKPRSTEINLEKLFNDFAKHYESTVKPGPNTDPVSSIRLVKEFSNIAPESQDVQKHLSGKNVLTIKRLKENFLTLISGQFGGDPNVKPKTKKDGVIVTKENKGAKIMNKRTLRDLVSEVLNENSGQGYAKYPYHSDEYSEDEPDEDYMVEWKAMVEEVCGSKRKNVDGDPSTVEDSAIEVAKILVKDSDLFRDVLEMAGANKSIGVEIMRQLKNAKEKKNLDRELDV